MLRVETNTVLRIPIGALNEAVWCHMHPAPGRWSHGTHTRDRPTNPRVTRRDHVHRDYIRYDPTIYSETVSPLKIYTVCF